MTKPTYRECLEEKKSLLFRKVGTRGRWYSITAPLPNPPPPPPQKKEGRETRLEAHLREILI